MELFLRPLSVAVAAAAVAGAIAFTTAPSNAASAGYSLKISGPAKVQFGKAFVLTASGVDPEGAGPVYLDVEGFDAEVVRTCPAAYDEAYQLARQTGGGTLANSITEQRDSAGNWSTKVGGHGTDPGLVLICAYSHDTVGNTFATATFHLTVTGGGAKK